MSLLKKYASTESADAFVEAVGGSEQEDAPEQEISMQELLEPAPASWSDSKNVEMSDELTEFGVDSGVPSVKSAALQDAASNLQGQNADVVKQAVFFATAGRHAAKAGLQAASKGAKSPGAGGFIRKGLRGAGSTVKNFFRRPKSFGEGARRVGMEVGTQAYFMPKAK